MSCRNFRLITGDFNMEDTNEEQTWLIATDKLKSVLCD